MRPLVRNVGLVVGVTLGLALTAGGCRLAPSGKPAPPVSPLSGAIVFFGDSITRGMGLPEGQAFPALVGKRLAEQGHDLRCINAGVSGETTAEGLRRVRQYLEPAPLLAMVELGANDLFQGVDRRRSHANLVGIVESFQSVGAKVMVAGTSFPGLHPAHDLAMQHTYERVARDTGALLIPDLMAGVAGAPELNLPDGIHPNAAGQARLAQNAWPFIEQVIGELGR